MKILITGGHVTPALAIIDRLNPSHKNEIVFVGRKHALEREDTLSWEYKEVAKKGIKFIPLQTGRLTRLISFRTLRSLIKIPVGFFQAYQITKNEKPDVILSFGGYIAFPIALVGYLLRIPIYTHEQTVSPGLANLFIGILSKKVFLSFEESIKYFDKKKTVVTGNPLRSSIFKIINKPFIIRKNKQIIYITGGSLGSHSINIHLREILKELLKKYIVIHQTGETKEHDDYEKLLKYRNTLPQELKNDYFLKKHFFDEEIGYIYSIADLVVGRSGANTFFELLALQKPAILIPLPWSSYGEQQKQAELFKKHKLGEIFNQYDSSTQLLNLINKVFSDLANYKKSFNSLKRLYRQDAAKIIINQIFE